MMFNNGTDADQVALPDAADSIRAGDQDAGRTCPACGLPAVIVSRDNQGRCTACGWRVRLECGELVDALPLATAGRRSKRRRGR
jgi:uncharacterized Zn finger protein (UPF0148 family)